MADNAANNRAPATKADLDAVTIGGARPLGGPVHLADYDPVWPELFAREAARISIVLGTVATRVEHVGSTSVPGLAAKPIIDIVMEVADSSNESAYVTPLESSGYTLRIREPAWFEHRVLKGPDTDINLHVFTIGCSEVERMLTFRDHLRANSSDRLLYESTKRELAARDWAFIQNYADAKSAVIEQIIARAKVVRNEQRST
jgi:GrpB-like predicted nucleotidyltransferase (UPF0157 family)